ncbi:MAG TPA: DUF4388 domain-containing protein [Candidatus Polarisedimenticolia bacterium]|jgi:hypothetical protein|nr:DUF4388 domain-containing protein [Candidatus Polarisedimenticolia bacterium]
MSGSAQASHSPVPPPRASRDGEIRSTTIPKLFHEMSATRATGLLTVTDGPIRKSVQFKNGAVLFASSNQRDDRLNQFLLSAGIVGLTDLMKALEVMVATKDRLGEVLVRYKMLTPDQVEKYVRTQVCEIVYSTFQWTRGRFTFEEKPPASENITIGLTGDAIVIEGVKRIASWARAYEEIGGLNSEYRTTREMPAIVKDLPLSAGEKELVKQCDVPTSLEEMCESSKLPDLDVCRSVWALLLVGALMKA